MSIILPTVSLASAAIGVPIPAAWDSAIQRATVGQLQAGYTDHLEIYNASMNTLSVLLTDTTLSFTLPSRTTKRFALPVGAHALTATPIEVQNTTGLNSLVITYYAPSESQETFTVQSTPPGNGSVTSTNQTLIKNTTWTSGTASPITLSTFFPSVLSRVAYLAELIIFHGGILTNDYGIIGKSYAITLSDSLATVKTIAANYERPGTLVIPFPIAYTFGSSGAAILCGIIADNGGNFTYSGGITMIGYEL